MANVTHHEGPNSTSDKLEDQAASAALYVTKDSPSKQGSHSVLDEDGKLSSAGAATSLKYARAQDLPSFPSTGGVKMSSAGAAASLADSNKKSFQHWKPGTIPAANQAATRAKDYEMDPLWHPELSTAGSKAAILAHRDAHSVDIWKAPETEHGHSAAGQAFEKGTNVPAAGPKMPADTHQKALLAATGAMSSNRRRADSAPLKPHDNDKANASWALKAATSSHKGHPLGQSSEFTTGDPGFEASRIQNLAKNNVSRQMYTSNPPVSVEVEEKNRQDMLRASAVAMAQKMYAIQQSHIDDAKGVGRSDSHYAATRARDRTLSDASSSLGSETKPTPRYENLEEAARRLAQERLAKLHDEHAEYRNYYGQNTSPRSRLSLRNRRRASSQGANDDSDEEQSRRIRTQMSLFQGKLAEVDGKKRQADRDALLQAAHKKVTAQMNAMDEKIFQDTGKSSPQQRDVWEKQAREKAQRDSDERMINVGKVHIGGGKYLEQAEVDAIARARLQPTLDEISEKAEKQRALDEEKRLDEERQQRELARQNANEAEIKAEAKAAAEKEKREEKARKAEEKRVQKEEAAAEREKRHAEVAAEKERAKQEKEEKRKSRETKPGRFSSILKQGAVGTGAVGATAVASMATPFTTKSGTGDINPSNKGVEENAPEEETVTQPESSAVTEPAEPSKDSTSLLQATEPKVKEGKLTPTDSEKQPEPIETTQSSTSPLQATEAKFKDGKLAIVMADPEKQPTSPEKSDSKVKSWFKTRFRSSNKTQSETEDKPATTEASEVAQTKRTSEDDKSQSDSMRDVALAGRTTTKETEDMYGEPGEPVSPVKETKTPAARDKSPSISPVSSFHSGEEEPKRSTDQPESETVESDSEARGRKGFKQRLVENLKPLPDKETLIEASHSHPTEKTQHDDVEESRDQFEEEKLAPPPKITSGTTGSPVGSRERSKFKEEL